MLQKALRLTRYQPRRYDPDRDVLALLRCSIPMRCGPRP